MTSISLRKEIVPLNAIIISKDGATTVGYSKDATFYGKYAIGTATAATEPGGSQGSTDHTHSSGGAHSDHTVTTGSHIHSKVWSTSESVTSRENGNNVTLVSSIHGHLWTSDATSPTTTIASTGAHTHNTINNEVNHKTQFFLKHSESSIGLRRRNLGQTSIIMWGGATADLPARYAKDDNYDDKHIKGTVGSGSTPNEDLGTNTHQHDAGDSHLHELTLPTHTHNYSGNSGSPGGTNNGRNGGISLPSAAHVHSQTNINALVNASVTTGDSGSTGHAAHASLNDEPAYKTIYFANASSIGMREPGIPIGGIVMWLDAVASIPAKFQVADGLLGTGTTDMTSKYPKGEDASSPGTTGGSNTHQHAAPAGHTHSGIALAHEHNLDGSTSGGSSGTSNADNGDPNSLKANAHGHSSTSQTSGSQGPTQSLNSVSDTHQHDSLNSQPSTLVVSMIERLKPQ